MACFMLQHFACGEVPFQAGAEDFVVLGIYSSAKKAIERANAHHLKRFTHPLPLVFDALESEDVVYDEGQFDPEEYSEEGPPCRYHMERVGMPQPTMYFFDKFNSDESGSAPEHISRFTSYTEACLYVWKFLINEVIEEQKAKTVEEVEEATREATYNMIEWMGGWEVHSPWSMLLREEYSCSVVYARSLDDDGLIDLKVEHETFASEHPKEGCTFE